MTNAVIFTATRTVTKSGLHIIERVCENMPRLATTDAEPVHRFVSGCADGGDTAASLFCLAMWQMAEHHICIPDYKHNTILAEYMRIREQTMIAGVVVHDTGLPPLDRNEFMLDLFPDDDRKVVAFPGTSSELMRGSGTWACVRQARKRDLPIHVFPLDGSDPWVENGR